MVGELLKGVFIAAPTPRRGASSSRRVGAVTPPTSSRTPPARQPAAAVASKCPSSKCPSLPHNFSAELGSDSAMLVVMVVRCRRASKDAAMVHYLVELGPGGNAISC